MAGPQPCQAPAAACHCSLVVSLKAAGSNVVVAMAPSGSRFLGQGSAPTVTRPSCAASCRPGVPAGRVDAPRAGAEDRPVLRARLFGGLAVGGRRTAPAAAPGRPPARPCSPTCCSTPAPTAAPAWPARFWPDVMDASALASLRNAVWAVRRALEAVGGGAYLAADRRTVGIAPDLPREVDAEEFARLVARDEPEAWERAAALASAPLVPEIADEWALVARDELRDRLADALERLGDAAEVAGDAAGAAAWARKALAHDPVRERAHRALIRRLAAQGRRDGALAAYRRCRAVLAAELGVAPSAETRALAARLETAEAARRPAAPADERSEPMVGRAAELAALRGAWAAARAGRGGLVVVAGEAGIGKSRLLAELVAEARAGGARVARGAGLELEGAPPFAPWSEALRGARRRRAAPAGGGRLAERAGPPVPGRGDGLEPAASRPRRRAGPRARPPVRGRRRAGRLVRRRRPAAPRAGGHAPGRRGQPGPAGLRRPPPARAGRAGRREPAGQRRERRARGGAGGPSPARRGGRRAAPRPAVARRRARGGGGRRARPGAPRTPGARPRLPRATRCWPARPPGRSRRATTPPTACARRCAARWPASPSRRGSRWTWRRRRRGRSPRRSSPGRSGAEALPDAVAAGVAADLLAPGAGRPDPLPPRPDPRRLLRRAAGRAPGVAPRRAWPARSAPARPRAGRGGPPPAAGRRRRRRPPRARRGRGRGPRARRARRGRRVPARGRRARRRRAGRAGRALAGARRRRGLARPARRVGRGLRARRGACGRGRPRAAWPRRTPLRGRWLRTTLCYPREALGAYARSLALIDDEGLDAPELRALALAGSAWAEAMAGRPRAGGGPGRRRGRGCPRRPATGVLAAEIALARAAAAGAPGADGGGRGALRRGGRARRGARAGPDLAHIAWANVASAAACRGEFGRALALAERAGAGERRPQGRPGAGRHGPGGPGPRPLAPGPPRRGRGGGRGGGGAGRALGRSGPRGERGVRPRRGGARGRPAGRGGPAPGRRAGGTRPRRRRARWPACCWPRRAWPPKGPDAAEDELRARALRAGGRGGPAGHARRPARPAAGLRGARPAAMPTSRCAGWARPSAPGGAGSAPPPPATSSRRRSWTWGGRRWPGWSSPASSSGAPWPTGPRRCRGARARRGGGGGRGRGHGARRGAPASTATGSAWPARPRRGGRHAGIHRGGDLPRAGRGGLEAALRPASATWTGGPAPSAWTSARET